VQRNKNEMPDRLDHLYVTENLYSSPRLTSRIGSTWYTSEARKKSNLTTNFVEVNYKFDRQLCRDALKFCLKKLNTDNMKYISMDIVSSDSSNEDEDEGDAETVEDPLSKFESEMEEDSFSPSARTHIVKAKWKHHSGHDMEALISVKFYFKFSFATCEKKARNEVVVLYYNVL